VALLSAFVAALGWTIVVGAWTFVLRRYRMQKEDQAKLINSDDDIADDTAAGIKNTPENQILRPSVWFDLISRGLLLLVLRCISFGRPIVLM
jgi:hypothetical protein